jgi:chemotaxis protein MotB
VSASPKSGQDEFLWLVSLSDLMILLFVFFVTLFSFAAKNLRPEDVRRMTAILKNEKPPTTPVDEVKRKLDGMLRTLPVKDAITIEQKDDILVVQIKEQILFKSGEFALRGDARPTIQAIGAIMQGVPNSYRIGIEGHTDDVPIHTSHIADNWELSSRRAHSILLALGLRPATLKRAVVMGYGEMNPLAPNRTPAGQPIFENRQKNRRVTVRIYPD